MDKDELSNEELNAFMKAINHDRLLYLWFLRSRGIKIEDKKIRELETEVYPDLQEVEFKGNRLLNQRDVDELQLLLLTVEPENYQGNSFQKAILFRLQHTTLRMRKESNHQRPHFHIQYKKQYSASYAVDTFERLAGDVPAKYEEPILEWASRNRESLMHT